MQLRKLLMFSIVLLLSVNGCDSEDHLDISGTWHWLGSGGGIDGEYHTPETAGYHQKIVFSGDRYFLYRNDTLLEQARYSVHSEENTELCNDFCWVITFSEIIKTEFWNLDHFGFGERERIQLNGDTLSFTPFCIDCPYADYLRSK